MDKKKVAWSFVAVLLAVFSIWAVLSQSGSLSIQDLGETIRTANPLWIILAVLSSLGFIVFEGQAILVILRNVGYKHKHRQGFLYAAGDVYFSAITPSASGGQPASAFFMKKNGIPMSVITAVLVLNLVMYTLGILTVGLVCLIAAPQVFLSFSFLSRFLILLGTAVLIFMAVIFTMMLLHQKMLEKLSIGMVQLFHRLHLIKKPERWIGKIERKMVEYQECVTQMSGHKRALVGAYFWNLAQRVSQISVTAFVFLATGGSAKEAWNVWITQGFVAIGSNTVPIPGGMGVTDYLMLDGFRGMMANADAVRLELLSRGLAFYVCVLISGITVGVGYIVYHLRNRRKRK